MRRLGPWIGPLLISAGVAAGLFLLTHRDANDQQPAPSDRPAAAGTPAPAAAPAPETAASPTAPAPSSGAEARTLDGARTAALQYLALSESVVTMDEALAVDAQRAAASEAAADQLVDKMRQDLARLRQSFPVGPVRYRVAPLAIRVSGDGHDSALAEIAYVGVLSPPGMPAFEDWRISRYMLVWEREGWRISGEESSPTPRPIPAVNTPPAGPGALDATLDGFSSVVASTPQ